MFPPGSRGRRPPRARSYRGWRLRFGPGLLALCLGSSGCDEAPAPRLSATVGCELDTERIGTLRVEARGDFVPGAGTQVVFSGGDAELAWGDRMVAGVTVEGLFGQTVEAVGRTARLREAGDVPVYFAPVDAACAVPGSVSPRTEVAAARGQLGDVVVVGGRDGDGRLLDDVLVLHDEIGTVSALQRGLPFPSVGQTIHAVGERRFLVLGGAGSNPTALDSGVFIDLDDPVDPIGDPQPLRTTTELATARAFASAVVRADGRILVAGGCAQLRPDATCAVGEALGDAGLPQRALWIDVSGDRLDAEVGPDVAVPRFGASMLVARDDVVFVAGGRDVEGMPVHTVERLRPGATRFRPYGGDLRSELSDDLAVTGAGLLEGGVVVLVLADGRIHWLNETSRQQYRPWAQWCEPGSPCFADQSGAYPAARRGLAVLPGQRVLADGVVLPIGGLGRSGADVIDVFDAPGADADARRVDALPVALADGSVLLLGGHDPATGTPAVPMAARVRPDLDGPDERIPAVDRNAPGSMMARDLDRVTLEGDTLRLLPSGPADERMPTTRAHARAFRSASFRFEATVQVTTGEVVPHVVLEHGAVQAISVSLAADRVVAHLRSPQGSVQTVSCGATSVDWSVPVVLAVDVRPDAVELQADSERIAECPTGGEALAWSVGIGAAGSGQLVASSLRLRRQ